MSTDQQNQAKQLPLTETPEFKAAVKAAVTAAAKEIKAEVLDDLAALKSEGGSSGNAESLMEKLALHIAEISDQGTGRERVPPEVLAKMGAAHKRMIKLLHDAKSKGLKPEYRVISKVYLNERFIEPFSVGADKSAVYTEIFWSGAPNDGLLPINDIAKQIFAEFKNSVGNAIKFAGQDDRPLVLTHGGLIVKGDLGARNVVGTLPDQKAFDADRMPGEDYSSDGFGGKAHENPNAEFVHILGTVMPAARQNNQAQG